MAKDDETALKKRIKQDQQTIAFLLDENGDEASLDETRIAASEAALAKSKKPRR